MKFNLEISELECVAEDLAPWRRGTTQSALIIQVVLQARDIATPGQDQPSERVLEEWTLEYKQRDTTAESSNIGTGVMSRRQAAYQDTHSIYKRLVIFHRSLYAYLRMLPGFKIFKGLKRNSSAPYDIVCRIMPCAISFSGDASAFRFGAIETPAGSFQVAVAYATDIHVPNLEVQPSLSRQANVIVDYIQQPPTSAPPCRYASSKNVPHKFGRSTSLPQQPRSGSERPSGSSPDNAPEGESPPPCRHSWASNPVRVAAPKWPCVPDFQPATGKPPSLIPKSTPWSRTALSDNRPLPIPSPTSTLSLPASYPSGSHFASLSASRTAESPAAPSVSTPRSAPGPAQRRATGPPPLAVAEAALSQSPIIDQQSGFVLPNNEAVSDLSSARTRPVRLAQGGITAAAAAGQMEPLTAHKGAGGYGTACHVGHEAHLAQTASSGSSHATTARTMSSPMCIPGATLPRNQSLSQLHRVKAHDATAMPRSSGAERRPVLSAPEAQLASMHIEQAVLPDHAEREQAHAAADLGSGPQNTLPREQPEGTSHFSDCSTSHYNMSCSPQLPFAFTPASVSHSLLQKAGGELIAARTDQQVSVLQPAPGMVLGRDVSDLALVRRSSWSTKSFSQSELPWLGPSAYSFSPSPSMDPYPCITGMSTHSSQHLSGITGLSPASDGNHELGHGPLSLIMDPPDDEDDSLPFALDDYAGECSRQAGMITEPPALCGGLGSTLSASLDSDAAVGALARMLQEAPSLRSTTHEVFPSPQLDMLLADVENMKHHITMCNTPFGV